VTQVTSPARQKVGKGTAEKMSLKTTAENSQGWCRRDVVVLSLYTRPALACMFFYTRFWLGVFTNLWGGVSRRRDHISQQIYTVYNFTWNGAIVPHRLVPPCRRTYAVRCLSPSSLSVRTPFRLLATRLFRLPPPGWRTAPSPTVFRKRLRTRLSNRSFPLSPVVRAQ